MISRVFDRAWASSLAALAAGACAFAMPAVAASPGAAALQLASPEAGPRLAGAGESRPRLIRVSDGTPQVPEAHGPGHYEETSGLRQSPGCSGTGAAYRFSTPPIAPGHVITNFHFELRGDNKCGQARRWKKFNANCELVTDKPDQKTVVFQLFTNRDQCFASETFQSSGGESHNSAGVATGQHGAVTTSQMVFSYDVQ